MVEEQVAGHEGEAALLGQVGDELGLRGRQRERLLDEGVLAGKQGPARKLGVRRRGRRDHDRVERLVLEEIVEAVGRPRLGVAGAVALEPVRVQVAEPHELRVWEVGKVPREVGTPRAEAREADSDRGLGHSEIV